jgi:HTH-type transcriptional regulator/antitoxin HigA
MSTATVLADPAKMIAKGAPRVIHNHKELEVYTEALFKLTALENPSASEEEAIELLTMLVQRYEKEHWPIPKASPVAVVRHLIEHGNLTQRDLVPEFGTESAVSMFLSGQRNLTLEQVRKLSARFKLSADAFMPQVKSSHNEDRMNAPNFNEMVRLIQSGELAAELRTTRERINTGDFYRSISNFGTCTPRQRRFMAGVSGFCATYSQCDEGHHRLSMCFGEEYKCLTTGNTEAHRVSH